VLSTVLALLGDDRDTLIEILHAAETIGSDGDKANVLMEAARSDMGSDAAQRAFFSAANTNWLGRRPKSRVEVRAA